MPEDLFELQEAVELLKKRGHAAGQSSPNKEGMLYIEIDGKALAALDVLQLAKEPAHPRE